MIAALLVLLATVCTAATSQSDRHALAVERFAKGASGQSIGCRRFVDEFTTDGKLILPTGQVLSGQRTIFAWCEAELLTRFRSIDLFVREDAYHSGDQTVAVPISVAAVNHMNCRIVQHGIAKLHMQASADGADYGGMVQKGSEWLRQVQLFGNVTKLTAAFNNCLLPGQVDMKVEKDEL